LAVEVRLLGSEDAALFDAVAPGVFDNPILPEMLAEFLGDPRHHLAAALDDGVIVGFASAVRYVHPDKLPELWINEVGVAPTHQGRGLGKVVLRCLLEVGRQHRCTEAWVLTDRSNAAARALYASLGGRISPVTMSWASSFALMAKPRTSLRNVDTHAAPPIFRPACVTGDEGGATTGKRGAAFSSRTPGRLSL